MKLGSIVFAGLMLSVGLVYEVMALYMPRGGIAYPGPGFFPVMVGVFLIVTALGCLLQEILNRQTGGSQSDSHSPDKIELGTRNIKKTLQLMALMVAYIFALQPLGFPIAICIFLVVSIRIFGYPRWVLSLAMAAIIAGISYVSFVLWLKVPLPLGILEEVLG